MSVGRKTGRIKSSKTWRSSRSVVARGQSWTVNSAIETVRMGTISLDELASGGGTAS
jgi:hypothetical protein